jgi:hypothetical protein
MKGFPVFISVYVERGNKSVAEVIGLAGGGRSRRLAANVPYATKPVKVRRPEKRSLVITPKSNDKPRS